MEAARGYFPGNPRKILGHWIPHKTFNLGCMVLQAGYDITKHIKRMNIDFTTMMPAHKLVEWNKYVTGLEHLTTSCSENSDEVNTTSKESIDKHSDDVNTTMDFLETDIVQKTLSESDNTLPDVDIKTEESQDEDLHVTVFQPLSSPKK